MNRLKFGLSFALVAFVGGCGPQLNPGASSDGTGGSSSGSTGAGTTTTGGVSSAETSATTTPPSSSVGVSSSPQTGSGGSSESSTGDLPTLPLCLEASASRLPEQAVLADVDGDGLDELWAIRPGDGKQGQPNILGYRIDGLTPTSVYEGFVSASILGFADMDGDGLDDLHFQQSGGTVGYRRGQSDLTLDELAVPLMFDGPWSLAVVDAGARGGADVFRLVTNPLEVELHQATPPSFTLFDSVALPLDVPDDSELAAVHLPGFPPRAMLQLASESGVLGIVIVAGTPEGDLAFVAASDPSTARTYLGAVDLDEDGEPEIIALASLENSRNIEVLRFDGSDTLVAEILVEGVLGGAVGDFEGSGSPQLLYREGMPSGQGILAPKLLRLPEDETLQLADLPTSSGAATPVRPANFTDAAADELVAEICGFTCVRAPARLVPC